MTHNLGLTDARPTGWSWFPASSGMPSPRHSDYRGEDRTAWDGEHHVPLDKLVRSCVETGADMKTKYEEDPYAEALRSTGSNAEQLVRQPRATSKSLS
jgi:hypothetical protein